MSRKLEGVEPRNGVDPRARRLAAQGLHELAVVEHASLVVVGSTHTGRLGRVYPGSTGEKLLHGAPCAVAIVPRVLRRAARSAIGVAYDGSDEAKAALDSAVALAEAFGAELELIGVAASDWYTGPALAGGIGVDVLREEIEQDVRERLERARGDASASAATAPAHGRPGRRAGRAQRRSSTCSSPARAATARCAA